MAEKHIEWTTEKLNEAAEKFQDGTQIIGFNNPFYEINKNGPTLLRANLARSRTLDETIEFAKCFEDVCYFAENYAFVKNEKGETQKIVLRDYQWEILRNLQDERFNLICASRQVGKCIRGNTLIEINGKQTPIALVYYKELKKQRKLTWSEYFAYISWSIYYKLG